MTQKGFIFMILQSLVLLTAIKKAHLFQDKFCVIIQPQWIPFNQISSPIL